MPLPIYADALYLAVATVQANWGVNTPPANVDARYLLPVTVQIGWPVNTSNGSILGNTAAGYAFSFYIRKP